MTSTPTSTPNKLCGLVGTDAGNVCSCRKSLWERVEERMWEVPKLRADNFPTWNRIFQVTISDIPHAVDILTGVLPPKDPGYRPELDQFLFPLVKRTIDYEKPGSASVEDVLASLPLPCLGSTAYAALSRHYFTDVNRKLFEAHYELLSLSFQGNVAHLQTNADRLFSQIKMYGLPLPPCIKVTYLAHILETMPEYRALASMIIMTPMQFPDERACYEAMHKYKRFQERGVICGKTSEVK